MARYKFSRLIVLFWFGLLALTANGIAQNQLSLNVLKAKLNEAGGSGAGHIMPDGTFMLNSAMVSAAMATANADVERQQGGHTNKGHADCLVCGGIAAIAVFAQADAVVFTLAASAADGLYRASASDIALSLTHSPYAARAPPHRIRA